MGCYFLLLGIFLTQGSNPGLLHWQADSLLSEPPGEPNMSIRNSNVHVCRLSFIGKQSHPFIYGLSMVTVTISAPWSCCHRDHLAWKAWNIYYPASCFKRKPSCLAHQQLPLLWITRKHTSTANSSSQQVQYALRLLGEPCTPLAMAGRKPSPGLTCFNSITGVAVFNAPLTLQ